MSTSSGGPDRRITVLELKEMKQRGDRIAALTAYDYLFARWVDQSGADVILVGDSLGSVIQGLPSTIPVTLDEMIYHAKAVRRGVERALLVVDLPFLTYQVSREDAIRNAGRVLKETGAEAVKLEGGTPEIADTIRFLTRAGIPVMGHLGFTPQAVHSLGGNKVQGRDENGKRAILEAADRISDAGAFAMVLELMPTELATAVTNAVDVPTIGIGAGAGCDGQVLVLHDMLGLNAGFKPRFLRRFAELGEQTARAVEDYVRAVKDREYPGDEHGFS